MLGQPKEKNNFQGSPDPYERKKASPTKPKHNRKAINCKGIIVDPILKPLTISPKQPTQGAKTPYQTHCVHRRTVSVCGIIVFTKFGCVWNYTYSKNPAEILLVIIQPGKAKQIAAIRSSSGLAGGRSRTITFLGDGSLHIELGLGFRFMIKAFAGILEGLGLYDFSCLAEILQNPS